MKTSPSEEEALYWTDDLPVCGLSGVGFATNQLYRKDGTRREEHEFEDNSFHFRVEGEVYLYGVMDGHHGSKASKFAAQRFPAEVLLGQLNGKKSPQEIEQVLQQAFLSVEKGFCESLDDRLTERAKVKMDLPKEVHALGEMEDYSQMVKKLEEVDKELDGGSMAAIALIKDSKLYVANIGCSRALLCCTGHDNKLWVHQLTVDHDLNNDEELQRLLTLGLDVETLRQVGKLGSRPYTRTIGDILIKTCYREFEYLSSAVREPVIAEPDIRWCDINASCAFLLLMSDGLYSSLENATGSSQVNVDIAHMVAAEMSAQVTLNGVAQAVIDRVVRLHHDAYMTSSDPTRKELCQHRDDITLLVRTFTDSHVNQDTGYQPPDPLMQGMLAGPGAPGLAPLSIVVTEESHPPPGFSHQLHIAQDNLSSDGLYSAADMGYHIATMDSTISSTLSPGWTNTGTQRSIDSEESGEESVIAKGTPLPLNKLGQLEPYVNFTEFYDAYEKLSEEEKKEFDKDCELRADFETIAEENEPCSPEWTAADESVQA